MSVTKARLLVIGIFLIILGLIFVSISGLTSGSRGDYLTVSFLDVGQGDAIFIETPEGVQLLIDGGPDNAVLRELPGAMPWFDRSIDMVLGTHPDKDHIGGLVEVLKRYQVANIVLTENLNDTAVFRAFEGEVDAEGGTVTRARAGQQIDLGSGVLLLIFSPASDPTDWESNTSSIVAQLRYGEIEFMLTGDATANIEDYLASSYGAVLESEVLKLGHHGSKTSTSGLFLDVVAPKYAVVSAGKSNNYGHPNSEVVSRVLNRGIELVSTIEQGTITFKSDGREVWLVK